MNAEVYLLDESDNVAVSFSALTGGTEVVCGNRRFLLLSDLPAGHKVAVSDIKAGGAVIKYGAPIGKATEDIAAGEHVHSHNLATALSDKGEYLFNPLPGKPAPRAPVNGRLRLYRRKNGRSGIRNELWVVPTVGCVNGVARNIAEAFLASRRDEADTLSGVDGVYSFSHPYGCSQLGDDHLRTRRLLQNLVLHPNAGGVLVVGLGCENNQVKDFIKTMPESFDSERIRFMEAQAEGDEVAAGKALLDEIYAAASGDKRTAGSWADIVIGLECGGSDAFSGITANPLIGMVSDHVIAGGGTTVLTEVPEMFGAEQILMRQCRGQEIFQKTAAMINSYKEYYTRHNQPVYENPSPGNKAGGITTLEEKSLGCIRKSGSADIADVVEMDDRIRKKGLNLLYAPGNDIVATTVLGTSGCQLVLFSTGRGTPLGGFIPTLKIASNSDLASRKKNWVDFNAGLLAEDGSTRESVFESLIEKIISVINGGATAAERNNNREIALFKTGVTL